MIRIAGVNLEENWRVNYALTKIKGIGWSRAKEVTGSLAIGESKRLSDLSTDELNRIGTKLGDYRIEGDLIRKIREDLQRLKVIGSYRGMRHARGLPVRGQRTRSNARTKRGKRKTVGAFKKEAMSKAAVVKKEE